MAGQGLNLVMTDIPPELEREFNRWYDEEHTVELLALPGVLSARRYRILSGQPKYLAMYELEDPYVTERPDYRHVGGSFPEGPPRARYMASRFVNTRKGIYRHLLTLPSPEPADVSRAQALMLIGLNIDPVCQEEFEDWYNTEHLPRLSRVPGVVRARRYKVHAEAPRLVGNPPVYMAVYEIEGPEVPESEEWRQASETSWTKRLRRFHQGSMLRNVYERILPA